MLKNINSENVISLVGFTFLIFLAVYAFLNSNKNAQVLQITKSSPSPVASPSPSPTLVPTSRPTISPSPTASSSPKFQINVSGEDGGGQDQ